MWHNVVAGGMAGAGARLATAPLDLIRIRAQLERNVTYPRPSLRSSFAKVVQDEGGFVALFRGGVAGTYLWIGYSTVQFAVYGRAKKYLESTIDEERHPTAIAFFSGAAAGLCATLSTYPFDICRTVFAARGLPQHSLQDAAGTFKPPKSLYDFAFSLYKQKGLRAFYAGSGPASIQIMPYMGLNFAIYDKLTSGDKAVGASAYAGTISGATSKILVYPLDTVKRRLQAQAVFGPGDDLYAGMVDCFSKMIRKEGKTSLYRGLLPSVLKTAIATGLSFSLYRCTKNLLERRQDDWDGEHEK
jgi:solute carrier family 25 thiamine pyrophosphate transporter 19